VSEWLTAIGPEGSALALLLLGHVLGDFTFQTERLAERKHRLGPLVTHVGIVTVVHALALLPLLSATTAVLVAAVGAAHLCIDAVTARLRDPESPSVARFLGDQAAHVVVLLVAWSVLEPATWTNAPVVDALGGAAALPWAALSTAAVYVAVFAFAHEGANTIVRGVLPDVDLESDEESQDIEAGHLIGTLERWVILVLGLAGRWESVALVVAVKSIARFEELKQRAFAEYFLVGTLSSVLVAVGLVLVASALV
jgi:hypothetical protein